MAQIGIFFGTDSGTTRLIAKKIAKKLKLRLGDEAVAKPLNVNRATPDDLLAHSSLIMGTPTYGKGALPGKAHRNTEESWLEFLSQLAGRDLSGRRIALYGLGDQEEYPAHFLDAMRELHDFFSAAGAEMVGGFNTDGFQFERSRAVVGGRFVGLALDQHLQHLLTDERIDAWLDEVVPALVVVQPRHLDKAG
ncbi:MAG: flavodoxin [Chromatiaceae bacterium]|nr:flavodoxin [Chromatiaceae bacterium]